MKDLRKLIGIIFVAAIIVCAMASCDLLGGGIIPTTPPTPTAPATPSTPGNGNVTGVSLNKSSITLLVGGTEALTPTITPSTATNQNITWTSSNVSAATVSAGGLVTAVATGTATITVKTQDGDKTASCTVTVNPVPVNSVSLKSSTSLIVGGTETLVPTITPPNAANQNVTWNSNNTGAATVSANGTVTAVAAGTATITVKTADGNKTADCVVTVVTSAVPVTGVSLNKSSTSLNTGGFENLVATITPSAATNQNVTWTSSNASVATVTASGLVTAVAVGTATITVKTQDGDKTASCTVTVNAIPVSGVSIKSTTSLIVGGTETLVPTITPSNAANQNVTWTSNNASIATVSASGLVTAVADGTATITVTTADGNKTATCTVSVAAPAPTIPTFTTIAAFKTWLDAQPNKPKDDPYNVALNLSGHSLSGFSTDSGSAGKALLDNPNKYVSLDLSGSTIFSIGTQAFNGCTSLVNVTIGNNVTSIGRLAFGGCNSLTAINAASGNNAFTAEDGVLYNKSKTTIVCYPAGKIGSSFTIPNGVTSIGEEAFRSCTGLTSITIPSSVTSIGQEAFFYCTNLATINVASGNTAYTSDENGVLYNKNKTTLICYPGGKTGSFTIPGSVTGIGNLAFSNCSGLTGITIPNSVTNIGEGAFGMCTSLTSVTIPSSVTSIGIVAFGYCESLTSVTFQGMIASNMIDNYAFNNIGDLREKYLAGGIGTYTRPSGGYDGTWTKTGGGVAPGGTYIITGSGTSFTATNGGATIGTANKPIQDVIDAIKTHATGKDVTIQFGDGTATLDIGTAYAEFNNSGGTWGAITLTGKITSAVGSYNRGTIFIHDSVSVTSTADIANNGGESGYAILNYSPGTVSITGGTVSATSGIAVASEGGTLTVSGTARVTSANAMENLNPFSGTISNSSNGSLLITGGTVENTANGAAIHNVLGGSATISGGTVSATSGIAVANTGYNYNTTVSITGGTVSATSGYAVAVYTGTVSITGGTVSTTSGIAVRNGNGRTTVSGTAKVTSANTNTSEGTICLKYNFVEDTFGTPRIEITGGTVENTSTTTGNAVRSDSNGPVSITGGKVSKAGNGNYAVYKGGTGAITIGAGATIVGYKNF